MGTRATVTIMDDDNKSSLVSIYRQYDGYPDGLGRDLKNLLKNFTIVNGFNSTRDVANGMGCLAAQVIKYLKDGVGNVYVIPNNQAAIEEFHYVLYPCGSPWNTTTIPYIKVYRGLNLAYDGPIKDWNIGEA